MRERAWPQALAVLAAAGLFVTLPDQLVLGPSWVRYVIPVLELLLCVVLVTPTLHRMLPGSQVRRTASIALIALIGAGNAVALGYLIHQLLYAGSVSGRQLLYAAFDVWVTNLIVFGLLYWELDGGSTDEQDFLFPQQGDDRLARGWSPHFTDYLYVSYTNATAFSPTDTMPLTRRAKMLMLLQSAISIVTLILVAARAVNIIKT